MAKLYRVELSTLKSWRSGSKRFVSGYPHYLSEKDASPFMIDAQFKVTEIESKAHEDELVAKGVVKAAPSGEQPRLSDNLKDDTKREDLSEPALKKKQFLKKAVKIEAEEEQ